MTKAHLGQLFENFKRWTYGKPVPRDPIINRLNEHGFFVGKNGTIYNVGNKKLNSLPDIYNNFQIKNTKP